MKNITKQLRVQERTREITELNEKLMREMKERATTEEELYRSRQMLQLVLDNIPQRVFWKDHNLLYLGCNRSFAEQAGLKCPGEIVGMDDSQMPWENEANGYQEIDRWVIENDEPRLRYESPQTQPDGSTMWQRKSKIPLRDRNGAVIGVMGTFEDITESKRIKELLIKSENILAEAQAIAHLGSWEYCLETKEEYRSAEFYRILGIPAQNSGFAIDSMFDYIHPEDRELVRSKITETLEQGRPYNVEYRIIRADGRERFVHAKGKTITDENDRTTRFIGAILDITERKQAEERNRNQLERLAALRAIDMAISDSLNLRVTLNVVLDQVVCHLGADAADILLLNHACKLEHAASRGFKSNTLKHASLSLGKGSAGCVALDRRTIHIPDMGTSEDASGNDPHRTDEGFISYYGSPLVAKGEVVGVLEVFYRSGNSLDEERLDFLETLAGQAAIAIDSANLFSGLQRTNIELMMAYDSTLEGWSRALDLRDKETEGHSQRVTDMAERIARAIGVPDKELIHVRRGAMLHDIGKMGIPDHILLKPGPLDQDERAIMERHPNHAFELLSPISFLQPALDIPYCHHEK